MDHLARDRVCRRVLDLAVGRPMNLPSQFEETSALREIVRRHGTPTYAFDIRRLREQAARLQNELPDIEILYSLKANASLGICEVFRECGLGADVASAGELATAVAAGFAPERIFVAGPFKLAETIAQLRSLPSATVSVDSMSELESLLEAGITNPLVLRLRPDFGSCAAVPAGSESRFGFTCDTFDACRRLLHARRLNVVGFHVFAGSQVLDVSQLKGHLRKSLELSLQAAEQLEVKPRFLNLGGGFGIPYDGTSGFDLSSVAAELRTLSERAAPARLIVELGRYLVAEAGWYLTSVVGRQTFQGRPAVIVDGGVHQRADMCGLHLRTRQSPPLVLASSPDSHASADRSPTTVLGCLSLPDDVLLEDALLPPLEPGDVLAFFNAGAYGLWSSAALFHGSPLPAEVAFDGPVLHPMRDRRPAASILDDQHSILHERVS